MEAIGYSGGIWLGWKEFVQVEVLHSHPQFVLARVRQPNSLSSVFISFVYGSPNRQVCKELWRDLMSSIPSRQVPWLAIGDFNVILSASKKIGGRTQGRRCFAFGDFVDSADLYDIGFSGPPFTWHSGSLFERLD